YTGRVRVPEVHQAGRLAMQTDGVDAVTVEVPHERLVARVAELERVVGRPQPLVGGSQLVDDVEALFGRPVDRDRVPAVPVEIAGNRDVPRVAEVEGDVGHTLSVRVPQIHVPVALAIEPRCLDPVPIPVATECDVERKSHVWTPVT